MRIILIRHGETAWNIGETRFRGQMDIELSDYGKKQAEAVGKALGEENIDLILFSPMSRCHDTANTIKKFQEKSAFKEEPLLIDINFGDWQGRAHTEVFKEDPEAQLFWNEQPENLVFPNGETWYSVYERLDKLFKKLRKKKEKVVVLVSHRVVLNILMLYLIGLDPSHFWDFHFDNASVSEIKLEINGSFRVMKLNDTHHLTKKSL
ncbi:MAG: histidine phosphatase family protein [Candidatus Heimdallarchaeota archaeon]